MCHLCREKLLICFGKHGPKKIKTERTITVQKRGDGADDPRAISSTSCIPSPASPWSNLATQPKSPRADCICPFPLRKWHLLSAFPSKKAVLFRGSLIYNEPCVFACLFVFFLIKVLLHQAPHFQSDIVNFLPCLPIPHHTKVSQDYTECLKMGTTSSDANLGSAEPSEVLRYPLVLEPQESRTNFTLMGLFGAGGEKYAPYQGIHNTFGRHRLSFLHYQCVGTWTRSCPDVLSEATPHFSFNSSRIYHWRLQSNPARASSGACKMVGEMGIRISRDVKTHKISNFTGV